MVGAGPAGSSAARRAAEFGLSVIVIDKRVRIGEPVQCAEYIPAPLGAYAAGIGIKIQLVKDMVSAYEVDQIDTHPSRGIIIDRAKFDRALSERAQRAGASIQTRTSLLALDQKCSSATVSAKRGSQKIEFKVLVAADGAKSRVAKLLRLQALAIIKTRQYTVELCDRTLSTNVWLSSQYPGGYAWLFPRGKYANIGVGFYTDTGHALKNTLDAFHQTQVNSGRVSSAIISRTGGAIPVDGIREPLTCENIVFAGDAAGLTHPISGAGIAAAVLSGELAGEAAALHAQTDCIKSLRDYEINIHDLFEVSLCRALQKRASLRRCWMEHRSLSTDLLKETWINQ